MLTIDETKDALHQAFLQDVRMLFSVYKNSYITSQNATEKQAALNRFKKGLEVGRKCLQDCLKAVG